MAQERPPAILPGQTNAWKTSFESRTPRSVSRRWEPERSSSPAANGAESPRA